jgi:hypothetical protein
MKIYFFATHNYLNSLALFLGIKTERRFYEKRMVLDFAKEAIQNAATHSINFDDLRAGKANIKVFGCGGAGCNTITWLFNKGINGATVYGVNTDALHLSITKADEKVLIGKELTRGLGAGGFPAKGREAAKEALSELPTWFSFVPEWAEEQEQVLRRLLRSWLKKQEL